MTRPLATKADKTFLISAGIGTIVSFALIMLGEWGVGVGSAGVTHRLLGSIGFVLFGLCLFAFAGWFGRATVARIASLTQEERAAKGKAFLKQLLIGLLNVIVYGGCALLILGGISALDKTGATGIVAVLLVWVAAIGIFVAYRRFRKQHPLSFAELGNVFLLLFLLAGGCLTIFLGLKVHIPDALQDMTQGPRTADVVLADVKRNTHTGRYRAFQQNEVVLTFVTAERERIVLIVPDSDAKALDPFTHDIFAHLTYYPATQIFVSAESWDQGEGVIGPQLLDEIARGEIPSEPAS